MVANGSALVPGGVLDSGATRRPVGRQDGYVRVLLDVELGAGGESTPSPDERVSKTAR